MKFNLDNTVISKNTGLPAIGNIVCLADAKFYLLQSKQTDIP